MSNKTMDKVAEMAAKRERERIIKLLEEQTDHACPDCLDRAINDAIALIKGENE